jgi:hypothetical protein
MMPFSRLLLIAASSKRHIAGASGDRVSMEGNLSSGEVTLFFKIDEDIIRSSLNMQEMKCCDGLVFYARDGEEKKTICLVELKGSNLKEAAEQINTTRERLEEILRSECSSCSSYLKQIIWKACIYRRNCSVDQKEDCKRLLLKRFRREDITFLYGSKNDVGAFLRGEGQADKNKVLDKPRHRNH